MNGQVYHNKKECPHNKTISRNKHLYEMNIYVIPFPGLDTLIDEYHPPMKQTANTAFT